MKEVHRVRQIVVPVAFTLISFHFVQGRELMIRDWGTGLLRIKKSIFVWNKLEVLKVYIYIYFLKCYYDDDDDDDADADDD